MAEEHAALEEAIAIASQLDPEERIKLRHALDEMIGELAETDKEMVFKQLLMNKGLISQIRRPQQEATTSERRPVPVRGKPVSATIIEDRD